MKHRTIVATAVTLGLAAAVLTPAAHAGNIGFGITIGGPGYAVSVGNAGWGGWFAPAPVLVGPPAFVPAPVVVAPPVRVVPQPVFVPTPVYVAPRPIIVRPPVRHAGYRGPVGRPIVVAPRYDARYRPAPRPGHPAQVAWGY